MGYAIRIVGCGRLSGQFGDEATIEGARMLAAEARERLIQAGHAAPFVVIITTGDTPYDLIEVAGSDLAKVAP